ncbi:hypothetical protein EDB80DRAFT_772207 [Ilyonectria destructans]|nr:hypothetical protein EDB80DRAFT_772207 [Ilyonectria destructans]
MMSIGTAPYVIPGGTDLIRKDDSGPIKDCIADHFNPGKRSEEAVKLDTLFTAQNLDRIAGLKITWTDDISDHLRLFKFDTKVAIVHHVSFLMMAKHAFKFWHDRLVILKQAFDECDPSTWKQWWFDPRKGIYRWPFLVAAAALVLTAFFGPIQCIVGPMPMYKSYQPS